MRGTFILICLALTMSGAMAQGFYNNGAVLSISPQTILSVPDSLVNKGTLINDGSIIIAGAWINTGTYNPGTGQVDFNSNLDQVINHNAQSIERLVISGGGQKEFLADIIVRSELTLTDGILLSKNGARLMMDQNVTINGGSDASHINGPVERKGTGDWLFPIGNGTRYLPVVIKGVTNSSAFGIVTLHELTGTETLTGAIELEKLSVKRYFELVASGDPGNAQIQLPLVDEDALGSTEFLTVAGANAATGPYSDMGRQSFTGDLTEGTVTSEGKPTFKYYTVATVLSDRSIEVFNALSPGDDGKNDFMEIRNIVFYPGNKVVIHNRWGDRVYETVDYDNQQNSFRGFSENGSKLPAGTYFYSIDLNDGSKPVTGYVIVR